ncbi:MAG: hypothetical protein WCY49_03860 [Anaerovoracaceae bacterium]|nr:hypothetical protein [Clostridiales bacterium]
MNVCKKSTEYIKTMNLLDMGLLKNCMFFGGLLTGLFVKKEAKVKVAAVSGLLFTSTLLLVTAPFLKYMMEEEETED